MALLMAVPMVGIYMPLYDYTRGALQPELGASLAPLTAGALSRTAAVLCTAPLDLLRTRMQVDGRFRSGYLYHGKCMQL